MSSNEESLVAKKVKTIGRISQYINDIARIAEEVMNDLFGASPQTETPPRDSETINEVSPNPNGQMERLDQYINDINDGTSRIHLALNRYREPGMKTGETE